MTKLQQRWGDNEELLIKCKSLAERNNQLEIALKRWARVKEFVVENPSDQLAKDSLATWEDELYKLYKSSIYEEKKWWHAITNPDYPKPKGDYHV